MVLVIINSLRDAYDILGPNQTWHVNDFNTNFLYLHTSKEFYRKKLYTDYAIFRGAIFSNSLDDKPFNERDTFLYKPNFPIYLVKNAKNYDINTS